MENDNQELPIEERIAARFTGLPQAEETSTETPTEVAQPDFAEVDWNGAKYQIPAALKEAFIHHDDYTKKTQALADDRRQVDHIRQVAENTQAEHVFMQTVAAEHQEL